MMKRLINVGWRFYNLYLFNIKGIKHGRRTIVHGQIGLRVWGKVIIGDNCYISSGEDMNPLSAKDKGYICVEKGAQLTIGDNCGMSSPRIWAHQSITIGNHVQIGANCIILDSDCHSLMYQYRRDLATDMQHKEKAPIVIEDDVLVGTNSIILKGVTVGARSIIGAGSIVTKSIPPDCIAAGNPCKVIKQIIQK